MEVIYPHVSERVKAAIIDSLVLIVVFMLILGIFSQFEDHPVITNQIIFISIFFLYDPIFTSIFGGTIGHMIMNIRVRRSNNQEKKILFHLAIVRYIVKVILGWVSLLTVGGNKKRKALHDIAVRSVVIYHHAPTKE